ncbi:hypothetical protein Taro_017692 [Colocasia esculenta]|uniref:Uncharacterized protein n=1 Tax=Colocasia esculenta TaxID=4460 RepID=A0A843UGU9_COLES|nr:hypothetical protein [Colocasia esculenta]
MSLRVFCDTGGLKQEPRRMSFCDTGGLEYEPRRVSFYDTGGLKHGLDVCRFMTPEDLQMCLDVCRFATPEDLNMANGGLVTTCGVSMRASAGGPDHGVKAPTGVEDFSRHVRPI